MLDIEAFYTEELLVPFINPKVPTLTLEQKEFMFVFTNEYVERKKGFKSTRQLQQYIATQSIKEVHIGPWWPRQVSHMEPGYPVLNYLVFDIDISDYPDHKRSGGKCFCSRDNFCKICFNVCLLDGAQELCEYVKRTFGWSDFRIFFSGRRGIHIWFFDLQTLGLTPRRRKIIAKLIQENTSVKIDAAVTEDPRHCVRLPFSLHGKTQGKSGCIPLPQNIREACSSIEEIMASE